MNHVQLESPRNCLFQKRPQVLYENKKNCVHVLDNAKNGAFKKDVLSLEEIVYFHDQEEEMEEQEVWEIKPESDEPDSSRNSDESSF